jgi:hypothetical protein
MERVDDSRISLRISKVDAAARQLETALVLWFTGGDPVSTHTLAAAAERILFDLKAAAGGPENMRDWDGIKDEYRKEWLAIINKPANFMKHADHDPEDVLDFKPKLTEIFLLYSHLRLKWLGHRPSHVAEAFHQWQMINRPELFLPAWRELQERFMPKDDMDELRSMPRPEFWKQFQIARANFKSADQPLW